MKNQKKLNSSYIITVISTSLVLLLIGFLGITIFHAKKISDYAKENIGFSIVMKEKARDVNIIKLKKKLDTKKYIKSTEYITKQQAAKKLQKELGENFIDFLGYNPLLPSIDVRFKAEYANVDSLALIEKKILANKNVKEIFYQKSLVQLLNKNIKKISFLILGFCLLLFIISVTLINNTIRLSVYNKRFIIRNMFLVGATQRFIRKPFIIKGILCGVFSSFFAILLLLGFIYFFQSQIPDYIILYDIKIYLYIFALVITIGIIISWISSYFAVKKYLNTKIDKLYY